MIVDPVPGQNRGDFLAPGNRVVLILKPIQEFQRLAPPLRAMDPDGPALRGGKGNDARFADAPDDFRPIGA